VCADAGWTVDEVDHVIPHQANLRIIEAAAKRLGVPMSKVVVNVEGTGNTSAASIPLAIAEADAGGRFKPGDKVVAVAFGAGATWGGAAWEWSGS
jgi:3-oxoacyl-[acyl-carrier-protein] synthase-3